MRTRSLVLALLTGLTGCRGADREATSGILEGHYVWGAEVNAFSPCGSEQAFWVDGLPEVLQLMQSRYAGFQLPSYQSVFVRVRGMQGPALDCGFCENYDGSLKVQTLLSMESPGPPTCTTDLATTSLMRAELKTPPDAWVLLDGIPHPLFPVGSCWRTRSSEICSDQAFVSSEVAGPRILTSPGTRLSLSFSQEPDSMTLHLWQDSSMESIALSGGQFVVPTEKGEFVHLLCGEWTRGEACFGFVAVVEGAKQGGS